jgi:hypothetical protein
MRAKFLRERLLPRCIKSATEQAEPKRAKPRNDIELPIVRELNIDTCFPTLAARVIEHVLPNLANCLKDIVLPKFKKSTVDNADPILANARRLIELLMLRSANTEQLPAHRELPRMLSPDPTLANCLTLKLDPILIISNKEADFPKRETVRVDKELPICRKSSTDADEPNLAKDLKLIELLIVIELHILTEPPSLA